MLVHALITTIRTDPEPTILLVLHSLNKEFADFFGSRPWISMFAQHDTAQLLFVPLIHSISLLSVLLAFLSITRVSVQILLRRLALNVQVMTELALATLLTATLLVELAQNSLWVDAKWNLLYLDRLEQLCGFFLGSFGSLLFELTLGLLSGSFLLFRVLVGCGLRVQLGNLSLGGSSFFLFGAMLVSCAVQQVLDWSRVSEACRRACGFFSVTYIFHAKGL